jgi:tripartite-type tricarboxylate transporter receptor subunit TctC
MRSRRAGISRRSLLAGAAGALAVLAGAARAQSFPSGPVKIVVTTGPGSSVDVCARVLADHLTRIWGQQVIVFNQPGAAGAIAIRAVAATPPDGHTLIMSLASNYIALPELQTSFPVDLVRDFVPIGFVGEHPMVIGAVASLKVSTLPELIALLKQRPGELNVAAGNRGSILHLTGEWLRNATGTQFTMLHYAAGSQSLPDLIAGRLQVMIDAMPAMRSGIEGGHLKPLAVATKQRLQNFSDLPTVAETIPGFEAMGWLALMAPPGTPGATARKISDDLRQALAHPDLMQRYRELGTYIRPTTPEELMSFIREQQQIWRPVIAETAKTMR